MSAESQSKDQRALRDVLRWICVPFAGLAAYVLAALAVGYGLLIAPLPMDAINMINPIPGTLLGSYYLGVSGAAVAPNNKLAAAIGLGILLSVWTIVETTIHIVSGAPPASLVFQAIAVLVASVSAALRVAQAPRVEHPFLTGLSRVLGSIALVGSTICGLWFIAMTWALISRSPWNLLNPFLDFAVLWHVLTTPQFWIAAVIAGLCTLGTSWATTRLSPAKDIAPTTTLALNEADEA